MFKVCRTCKIEKKLQEFGKITRKKDGHTNECKICSRERAKLYRSQPHRRLAKAKIDAKYQTNNQKKFKAGQVVREAVRKGELIKTNCEECEETENIHGHHDDYDKALEVRWLCNECHNEWHRVNGKAKNGD